MLTVAPVLSPEQLVALADLERRVVAADGGRLKLEWPSLREGRAQGVLAEQGGRLVGFAGLYAFGPVVEVAGAVDPDARRRGTGTALLESALARCPGDVLLVVPGGSVGGAALARVRGAVLDHSEHALVLDAPPADAPQDPRTSLRPAGPADGGAVSALLHEAFGVDAHREDGTLVVEHDGAVVGTLRLTRDGGTAGVYGFVVTQALRGRGLGRDVLRRVCRQAFADGAQRVALEVAVDNPSALHLYTSTGFRPVSSEDYWLLSRGGAAPAPAGSPPPAPAR